MATTTNFGWETPDDTDLVKDGAAAMRTLGNSIDASFVDLKGGTSGQMLTKASNTDLDYTWVTPQIGDITAITAASPITGGGTSGDVTIGILDGTTSNKGAVQLSTSTSSSSTSLAATASAVKSAYDLADGAIPKSLIDAAGDLIVGTAADTAGRLALGTAGQVLTVNAGATAVEWSTASGATSFVGCSLYDSSATQSISNNTSTLITWNSENFDTSGFHSTSTNTSRITIPSGKAGYYLFTSYGFFADNATGNRRMDLRKNGSLIRSWPTPATTNTFSGLTITCLLNLAVGDYIEIAAFQSSGGALNYYKGIDTGNQYGTFECQYLGA